MYLFQETQHAMYMYAQLLCIDTLWNHPHIKISTCSLEKIFISLQAGQNFPPEWQISLLKGFPKYDFFIISYTWLYPKVSWQGASCLACFFLAWHTFITGKIIYGCQILLLCSSSRGGGAISIWEVFLANQAFKFVFFLVI